MKTIRSACVTGVTTLLLLLNQGGTAHAQPSPPPDAGTVPAAAFPGEPSSPPQTLADTRDPQSQAAARLQKVQLSARLAALQEADQGYRPELLESLLSLGDVQLMLEETAEAADAYSEALLLVRANSGLYAPAQLPVLEKLFTAHTSNADWEAANTDAHLIAQIARHALAPGDPRRLAAVTTLGDWLQRSAAEELLSEQIASVADAVTLYRHEIGVLENQPLYPRADLDLATLQLALAGAEFAYVELINNRSVRDYQVSGRNTITTTQCQLVRVSYNQVAQVCTQVEVPNLDLYVASSQQKQQELGEHLAAMKQAIIDGFTVLSQETVLISERDALLARMQQLTATYNDYVTTNKL